MTKESPLYLAVKSKSKKLIKFLASQFYTPQTIDNENELSGMTPLMMAIMTLQKDVAGYFMGKFNANKNHKNKFGETILHIAKRKGFKKVLDYCLEINCNQKIPNNDGVSYYDIFLEEQKANGIDISNDKRS